MKNKNLSKLSISILMCLLTGFLGSIFTNPNIDTWYINLNKPGFNPPNWLFGPVWTALFIMMGVAFFLIWKNKAKEKELALRIFIFQLVINLLWSIAFFALKSPVFALLTIATLWLSIVATITEFGRIDKKAAWLLWPYLIWVSYASALNFAIVQLN